MSAVGALLFFDDELPGQKLKPIRTRTSVFLVFIAKNVTVVRGKLLVILTERLTDW